MNPETRTEKKLLTMADLHALGLKYSPNHLRRMIAAGRFPNPIKLGDGPNGHVAFIAEEIDAWIDSRTRVYRIETEPSKPSKRKR